MGWRLRKSRILASASSPMSIPRTVTPLDAKSLFNLLKDGSSPTQGMHQVAQKLTTTTLPLRAAVSMGAPARVVNWGRSSAADAAGVDGAPEGCGTFCSQAR